ncbi:hypothetical protein [Imtechella halotolerans]|uniref:Lipoprotein n=1 Tax=Imtechella halotolerans K1 TaxID=946077 RepID=I0W9G0_9FLAO|nr:hypothetical protein [Imtechella halotolerans]EID73026.1 hypothetical protein W5A_10784 [Imtechella halotolerans K1]WMQ62123.1 hypothetical protein PT603_07155 [Imtechella halotolerans]
MKKMLCLALAIPLFMACGEKKKETTNSVEELTETIQQQKNELSQKVDSVVDEMEKTKSEIDHSIKKIDSLLEDF